MPASSLLSAPHVHPSCSSYSCYATRDPKTQWHKITIALYSQVMGLGAWSGHTGMTTEATVHSASAEKMGRHDGWWLGSSRGSFTHTSGAWAGVISRRTSTGMVDWNAPQGLCMCLGFLTTWQPADSSPGGSGLQSSVPGNKTEGALWCHSVTLQVTLPSPHRPAQTQAGRHGGPASH